MKINIIAKGHYFHHYGDALQIASKSKGHETTWFDEDTYDVPSSTADVHIIVGPNVYNHKTIAALNGKKVGILTEQLPHLGFLSSPFVTDRFQQFMRHKDVYDKYVEWSSASYDFLRNTFRDLDVVNFPHGYIHHTSHHTPSSDCSWDAVFLGAICPRRYKAIDHMKKLGIKVYAGHEEIWGTTKYDALANSKVILNMHYADTPPAFEAHRIFDSASFGRPILSETINERPETLDGTIKQCSLEEMPTVLNSYLKNDKALDRDGALLLEKVRTYPMTNLLEKIL